MHALLNNQEPRIPWSLGLPVPLLGGMAACHAVAAVWILASNREWHECVTLLQAKGCLTVPNALAAPFLLSFKTAFFSAIFYTLTLGAGVSLLFMGLAWLAAQAPGRFLGKGFLAVCGLVMLAAANSNGFQPYSTAFFILIPTVSGSLMWRRVKGLEGLRPFRLWSCAIPAFPVVLLGLLWAFHSASTPFIDVRDTLLLSNRPGIAVNDFYYRYTLYAARTFKALENRPMRTVRLEGAPGSPWNLTLARKLLEAHYFPVTGEEPADVTLSRLDSIVALTGWHGAVLKVTASSFMASPERFLEDLSNMTDRCAPLRSLTGESLKYGLPLALYILGFAALAYPVSRFCGRAKGAAAASGIWMTLGLVLYFHLAAMAQHSARDKNAYDLIASDSMQDRIVGLRMAQESQEDVWGHPAYPRILKSSHILERYWLAKALSVNRSPKGYQDLLALLKDPAPNVQCQALWSLGARREKDAMERIQEAWKESDHVYVQLYAYNALKGMGWRQKQ